MPAALGIIPGVGVTGFLACFEAMLIKILSKKPTMFGQIIRVDNNQLTDDPHPGMVGLFLCQYFSEPLYLISQNSSKYIYNSNRYQQVTVT